LSALLPETASTASQLAAAIAGAQQGIVYAPPTPRPDYSLAGRISAICYGLASAHGVYAAPIILGLRIGGVLICVALSLFLIGHRRARDAA
jgi:protein SCO1